MKIIGINHDMYISSAALIVDGKIVSAIAEERLTREKMTRSFPQKCDKALPQTSKSLSQSNRLHANSYNPSVHFKNSIQYFLITDGLRGDYFYTIPDQLINKISPDNSESEYTKQEIQLSKNKLKVFILIITYLTQQMVYLSPYKKCNTNFRWCGRR